MAATGSEAVTVTAEREISATRVYDAPVALVWRMWTESRHIARWWGPTGFTNTIATMDVRPGGTWKFVMHGPDGRDYANENRYDEVVPHERLSYRHVSPPEHEVTVTFAPDGERTRVHMRMLFATKKERDDVARAFGAVEGMQQTLSRLDGLLSGAPAEFHVTRTLDAPRELVWKAWTEADRLARWWGPKGMPTRVLSLDLRPGGVFHYAMTMPHGEAFGRFLYEEVAAPARLVFRSAFADENAGVVRAPFFDGKWPLEVRNVVTFAEGDGKTTVALRATPVDATPEELAAFEANFASMRGGFGGTFEQLREYLAAATKE